MKKYIKKIFKKKTIEEKIEEIQKKIKYHRAQNTRGVDLYCTTWESNPTTRKGLNMMIKHGNKVVDLELKLVQLNVSRLHHSKLISVNNIINQFYDNDFRIWDVERFLKQKNEGSNQNDIKST